MRKISVFNFVTLNGLFKGVNEDISWHRGDSETNELAEEGIKSESILLFGRITYELMASFWTTPEAIKMDPIIAEGMNKAEKIVFSRTLTKADWNNSRVINSNIFEEIRKLKQLPGKDMTILGSGSIMTQFAEHNLIDEYQFMVNPIVLVDGTSIFKGIKRRLDLKLISTRTFKNGNILLSYVPI